MRPTPFLAPTPVPPDARLRLFCLPFAGGGVGIFGSWQDAMPHVHVLPVQLPGRERRLRDRPYTSMDALVADLLTDLRPWFDGPWAVFGHSMGAAVAYALARAATAEGLGPTHLFVSARRAPRHPSPHPPLFALPEERLVAEVERLYGPLPDVLRRHPGLLRTFLPTMRADFELLDTWRPPTDRVLHTAVTALGGARDTAVPPDTLDAWGEVTTGPFRRVVLDGDHFSYIRDAPLARDHVAAALREP